MRACLEELSVVTREDIVRSDMDRDVWLGKPLCFFPLSVLGGLRGREEGGGGWFSLSDDDPLSPPGLSPPDEDGELSTAPLGADCEGQNTFSPFPRDGINCCMST